MSHRYKRNRELEAFKKSLEDDLPDDYPALEAKMDAFFQRHPDIDVTGWMIHFGDLTEDATCRDCVDYPDFCKGGDTPLKCFSGQKFEVGWSFSSGNAPGSSVRLR